MDYLRIIAVSVFSLAALFVLTKIMGNRQVSQLTMFDYVIGISIGSIAAEMATELEKPVRPLVAMIVYAAIACIVSYLSEKSIVMRRILFGKSVVLMQDGKLNRKNFKRTHIDLNEFLMQCRSDGYFDVSDINYAVLEPSGKVSFLPFSDARPVTPRDIKAVPQSDSLCTNVIVDGNLLENNLKHCEKDVKWLKGELAVQGIKDIKRVFLATLDNSGQLKIYENNGETVNNDPFE